MKESISLMDSFTSTHRKRRELAEAAPTSSFYANYGEARSESTRWALRPISNACRLPTQTGDRSKFLRWSF
ncbi:hypothetical protein LB526_22450 [Mesorhizobium sp. CA6]|nr:hypothetical protein [Mesorhizobium sp. CA6]